MSMSLFISLGYYIGMCIAAPEKNLGYIQQVRLSFCLHICISETHLVKVKVRHH